MIRGVKNLSFPLFLTFKFAYFLNITYFCGVRAQSHAVSHLFEAALLAAAGITYRNRNEALCSSCLTENLVSFTNCTREVA